MLIVQHIKEPKKLTDRDNRHLHDIDSTNILINLDWGELTSGLIGGGGRGFVGCRQVNSLFG